MRVWRLARLVHADLDGEGAQRAGGRWNSPGRPLIYTSRHLSLAALELLVHLDSDTVPADLAAFEIHVPDDLSRARVDPGELASGWAERLDVTRAVGDAWLAAARTAVLMVPSVLVPHEENALVNPAHPDAVGIRVVRSMPFGFDSRLLAPRRRA